MQICDDLVWALFNERSTILKMSGYKWHPNIFKSLNLHWSIFSKNGKYYIYTLGDNREDIKKVIDQCKLKQIFIENDPYVNHNDNKSIEVTSSGINLDKSIDLNRYPWYIAGIQYLYKHSPHNIKYWKSLVNNNISIRMFSDHSSDKNMMPMFEAYALKVKDYTEFEYYDSQSRDIVPILIDKV